MAVEFDRGLGGLGHERSCVIAFLIEFARSSWGLEGGGGRSRGSIRFVKNLFS